MRITEDAKIATRQRILQTAQRLFTEKGFEPTTTRDITQSAKIATGTLFNYFLTKEDIAVTLVADALQKAHTDFEKQRREGTVIEEDLFAFVATGLRQLQPYRKLIPAVLEAALTPFAHTSSSEAAEALRRRQL